MLTLVLMAALAEPDLSVITVPQDKIAAYADGAGHYVFVELTEDRPPERYFYGDGTTAHLVSSNAVLGNRGAFEATLSDPRYPRGKMPQLTSEDVTKSAQVKCGTRLTAFQRLASDEEKALVGKVVFKRQRYQYQPYILARDDKGTYYYVDKGRFSDNSGEYRVFAGPRGAMKEQKLTNIVHDSGGDIFSTANGQLRLIVGTSAEWVNGKAKTALVEVPISQNVPMIFNDLGVYKNMRLGQPCDDL